MMNQPEIRTYLEHYFSAFDSPYVETTDAYFSVQLPVELDKELGNRPFYWTYVERIGMEPNPLTLTFIFDPEKAPDELRGEQIIFGSRRLHQIFESAKKNGKYVRLYEVPTRDTPKQLLSSLPLVPWLIVNYKVEFISDQKRDLLLPLGINLISGQIVADAYEKIHALTLTPQLPDYTFTMQPIFSLESATSRLEQYTQQMIGQEDGEWAKNANRRLKEEQQLIESFFDPDSVQRPTKDTEDAEEKTAQIVAEKERRLNELVWQFEPRIQVSVVNTGFFYLRSQME